MTYNWNPHERDGWTKRGESILITSGNETRKFAYQHSRIVASRKNHGIASKMLRSFFALAVLGAAALSQSPLARFRVPQSVRVRAEMGKPSERNIPVGEHLTAIEFRANA